MRKFTISIVLLLFFIISCNQTGPSINETPPVGTATVQSMPVTVTTSPEETMELFMDLVPCGVPDTVRLMAAQTIDMGTVVISNDGSDLLIEITTTGYWQMSSSHLHLAASPDGFPINGGSNPQIGLFDYAHDYQPYTQYIAYSFSLSDFPELTENVLYIAFHAEVTDGEVSETAWGEGVQFGSSWAMYFSYTIQECGDEPDDGEGYRTQTQGGWGTVAHGNNPGVYRDAHFDDAFPDGVTIGEGEGYTLHFTTSYAVQEFLPHGRKPATLTQSQIDPTRTEAGVLAAQTLALTLSVGFDLADPHFGGSPLDLRDLLVADEGSPFYGMTVQAVLDAANLFLGTGTGEYNAGQLNEVLTAINENYVDGTHDGGFLME